MRTMSRDARKVLDHLRKLTSRDYAALDVFAAEKLVSRYFPNVINNIVKQIYKNSKSEDRFTMDYYSQPVHSMGKQPRDSDMWVMTNEDMRRYMLVSAYLLEDFNNDQLQQLQWICQFSENDIIDAIRIGRQEQVFSIPYIYRILEGVKARQENKTRIMDQNRDLVIRVDDSSSVHRGPLEIASLSYGWQQAIEDTELMNKARKLFGGG